MGMAFDAHVLYALIASPGDTSNARDAIEHAIISWNSDRAKSASIVVLPIRWETDSVPLIGSDDGQSVINKQLVDDADIIFGVFHSRLGKTTARGPSGTAEEIARSAGAGKPVHVYFADMPHPSAVDPDQLAALNKFKNEMQSQGLFGTFVSEDDLKSKVRSAIEFDIGQQDFGPISWKQTPEQRAVLRAHYDSYQEPYNDSHGNLKHRTKGQKIVIRNIGTTTARSVRISLEPLGETQAPRLYGNDVNPDIIPDSEISYTMALPMGSSRTFHAKMVWRDEDDVERIETQTVTC